MEGATSVSSQKNNLSFNIVYMKLDMDSLKRKGFLRLQYQIYKNHESLKMDPYVLVIRLLKCYKWSKT